MQGMPPDSRKAYVAANQATRDQVNARIEALDAKRNAYIRDQLSKTKGAQASFDLEVIRVLQAQAKPKGISYE